MNITIIVFNMEDTQYLKDELIMYNAQVCLRRNCALPIGKSNRNCHFTCNPADESMFCLNCDTNFSKNEVEELGSDINEWQTFAFSRDMNNIERDVKRTGVTFKQTFDMYYGNEQTGPPQISENYREMVGRCLGGGIRKGKDLIPATVLELSDPLVFSVIISSKILSYEGRKKIAIEFLRVKFESYFKYLNDLKIGKEKMNDMFKIDQK